MAVLPCVFKKDTSYKKGLGLWRCHCQHEFLLFFNSHVSLSAFILVHEGKLEMINESTVTPFYDYMITLEGLIIHAVNLLRLLTIPHFL